MKTEILWGLIFCCLGIVFHYLKKYIDKRYVNDKTKYEEFQKENTIQSKLELNIEKFKIESFESYNRMLNWSKWFFLIGGIYLLSKSFFLL